MADMNVGIRVGATMDGSVGATMGRATGYLGRLQRSTEELQRRTARVTAFRTLQSDLGQTQARARQAAERVATMGAAMRQVRQPTKAMGEALGQARAEAARLTSRAAEQKRQLGELGRSMRRAGEATDNLEEREKRLTRTLERQQRRMARVGRAYSQMERARERRSAARGGLLGATVGAAAVAAPIVGVARAAIGFESAMADVRKVVDFETPEQFKAMGREIIELSKNIPVSAEGLAAIAAEGGKIGLARGELAAFSEDVAKITVAWDMAPDAVANAMGKVRTIFGGGREGTMALAGTINHLSNNMAATAPEILEFVKRVGPIGKTMSFTARETAAFGSTMVALGLAPERAARSMAVALNRLSVAPHVESGAFHDVLDEMGVDAEELSERLKQGGPEAFLDFLREVEESDVDGAISRLFGQEHVAQLTSLLSALPRLGQAMEMAADETAAANSVQDEYGERAKTTANNLQLLANKSRGAAIGIGSVLLPTINDAVTAVGDLVNRGAALAEKISRRDQSRGRAGRRVGGADRRHRDRALRRCEPLDGLGGRADCAVPRGRGRRVGRAGAQRPGGQGIAGRRPRPRHPAPGADRHRDRRHRRRPRRRGGAHHQVLGPTGRVLQRLRRRHLERDLADVRAAGAAVQLAG